MDAGNGNFKPIELDQFEEQLKQPKPKVFTTGENLEIRGSRLRVEKITRNKLVLKLLKSKSKTT
jgi:hypothetical protein